MNSKLYDLILKNRNKLNKMIEKKAPYEKILKQSLILDKYINQEQKLQKNNHLNNYN